MSARRIRSRIERLDHLASPPEALARILELASDPDAQLPQLASAIESDPVLAARLLRLANSAYFGYSREIETIDHSLVVLGTRTVRNLVAAVALAPVFTGGQSDLDRSTLWRHCCAVGEAARILAEHLELDGGVAYLAGLLHDVGKVALDEAVPGLFAEALEIDAEHRTGALDSERKALGVDHAWAGGVLLDRWQLPATLVEAIRFHHGGGEADAWLPALVEVADGLASLGGFAGPSAAPAPTALPVGPLARLGIGDDAAAALVEEFENRHDAIEALYASSTAGGA